MENRNFSNIEIDLYTPKGITIIIEVLILFISLLALATQGILSGNWLVTVTALFNVVILVVIIWAIYYNPNVIKIKGARIEQL